MAQEIQTETIAQIGIVRINRPQALNALNLAALKGLTSALQRFDNDPNIRCMLVVGTERAFATGADVAELSEVAMVELQQRNPLAPWDDLDRLRKPLIAAVTGYAVGSGCELALACDIVVASETARFGLPELSQGLIPGGGGTQRLTRAVGKAGAMEVVLTGRMLTAGEALAMGLVSRVVPRENCYDEALGIGRELCQRPPLALQLAKEAVRKAHETTLSEGLALERRLFYLLFATDDQKEGLRAFLEKRPPIFAGR